MKSKLLLSGVAIIVILGIILSGCSSGVSQEDYDEVVAERDAAQADVAELEAEVSSLEADIEDLEAQVSELESENEAMATALLPDVLTILGVVDEIEAWNADMTDTQLLGALTTAINGTEDEGLIESWDAFLDASAAGDPGMTIHQFYAYMLGQCSLVAAAFPEEVQPLMRVGDEMYNMVSALDISQLNLMTEAVNASGNSELIQRWNEILSSFQTDLPGAMVKMIEMQVWMLSEIAEAAPEIS